MNQPIKLSYMYCMNMQCKASIYHNMVELQIPYSSKNVIGPYTCFRCDQPLVSAIDIATERLMAAVDSQNTDEVNYLNN